MAKKTKVLEEQRNQMENELKNNYAVVSQMDMLLKSKEHDLKQIQAEYLSWK